MMYVAFSGGVDSTYLIHKLLKGSTDQIRPVILAPGGFPSHIPGDLIAAKLILDWFEANKDSYTGELMSPIYQMHSFIPGTVMAKHTQRINNVNQQVNVALGLMLAKKDAINAGIEPCIATGWLKCDCYENGGNPFDKTVEEMELLTKFPGYFGGVSGLDACGRDIQTPLWDMTKEEIYNGLPDELKLLVAYNGQNTEFDKESGVYSVDTYSGKIAEYAEYGIHVPRRRTYKLGDSDLVTRYLLGRVTMEDLGIDHPTVEQVIALDWLQTPERLHARDYRITIGVEHWSLTLAAFKKEHAALSTLISFRPAPTEPVRSSVVAKCVSGGHAYA